MWQVRIAQNAKKKMNTEFYEKVKEDYSNLQKYTEKQMKYAGLLLISIQDNVSPDVYSKIIDKHFKLMKEYDSANP